METKMTIVNMAMVTATIRKMKQRSFVGMKVKERNYLWLIKIMILTKMMIDNAVDYFHA